MALKKSPKRRNRFSSKKSAKWYQNRLVTLGGGEAPFTQQIGQDTQVVFCDNTIVSSKYTVFTFLFLNLFEQFRRVANFYFLIIAVIQLSLPSPPVSPFTSVSPLVFVVLVTMIKQGYEDFCRHRSDRSINLAPVSVLKDGQIVLCKSKDIKVGDIVLVRENETFPADLVLLATPPSTNGRCYVMTSNLDGETNLKTMSTSSLTKLVTVPSDISELIGQIECENPNPDLHGFRGRLKRDENGEMKVAPLSLENLVMRGTQLRNTEYVYGCAVYTGRDTKMSQNSKTTSNKFSTVEKTMNKFLLFFMGLLLFEVILSTSLKYAFGVDSQEELTHWYLGESISISVGHVAEDFFSYLVIYNYIIPISLYVTLEFQKFFGSLFLVWDLDLYDPEVDEAAKCNSSDLNEELGQIEILFSDKTGTLTQNVMLFKEASINGRKHTPQDLYPKTTNFSNFSNEQSQGHGHQDDSFLEDSFKDPEDENHITEFLSALCVCHTVQVGRSSFHLPTRQLASSQNHSAACRDEVEMMERTGIDNPSFSMEEEMSSSSNQDIQYNASSPDEKALVEACVKFGITFTGEKIVGASSTLHVVESRSGCAEEKSYSRLHVLEFDSTRKRMSVIVRDPSGQVVMYTKGAESSVIPRCKQGPIYETNKHIDDYALVGLRTLAVAVRHLSDNDLGIFEDKLAVAQEAIEGREAKVMAVYDEMERGMTLIGATAVEDKLQIGVKETLVKLGEAGISVWILTGDKKETAINISYSCGHLLPHMVVLDLTGQNSAHITGQLERYVKQINMKEDVFGLVVDGATLNLIMPFQDNKDLLFQVASKCVSVVCCRMSPLQKSEIVRMMKNAPGVPVTAAIGDGGNDVAMIQEAHVGLGIMGKEGRAAVRAADFAFSQFRFLQKVVLVHGHWYYYRVSLLVQYFFYKNVACFTCQLYYAFFNNFSTQTLFDSVSLTSYNIFYTSLPIFVFGLLEQNLKKEPLLKVPQFYSRHYRNKLLTWKEFFLWFSQAVWHSLVFYFGWLLFWSNSPISDGLSLNIDSSQVLEQASFGVAVYSSIVAHVNLRLLFQSRSWNLILFFSIVISILFYMGLTFFVHSVRIPIDLAWLFYDSVDKEVLSSIPFDFTVFWVYEHTLSSINVWLFTVLLLVVALTPDVVVRIVRKHWYSIRRGIQMKLDDLDEKMNRGTYELNSNYQNYGYTEQEEIQAKSILNYVNNNPTLA